MTKVIKYSEDILGWYKKPGPLQVWRVVEGRNRGDGKIPKFSIQEVPEDRFDDVLDLMMNIFVYDEPICGTSKIGDTPAALNDFRKIWCYGLQQGITVGAFLVDDENPRPILVGANMTLVDCEGSEKAMMEDIEYADETSQKILQLVHDLETEKNPKEIYNVDKFITAFGLCVHPDYRGHGLGLEILKARDEMMAGYDLPATSTVFTSPFAQKAAQEAGFEVLLERPFADIKNEDGTEMFPGIPSKVVKLMGKKFPG